MNVLVDRHHHALYLSLQMLFEDRLGMTLYTPIGRDWWDEEIWNFGRWTEWHDDAPQDRLVAQFLSLDGWRQGPSGYETVDAHHPDRVIRGVTLAQARSMDWAYVVASVQDNEQGFANFAREAGAQYVLHAGNVRQDIRWFLNPLVIATNESTFHGRGVRIHQEIDRQTFAYREPIRSRTIRSFVNCFASTPCHDDMTRIARLLPEVDFRVHGIDGANGNIETVREIAQLMAGSAFGWHDKIQGDGFGHVIHDWAAVGRPLIGHASHYRGLMAERLWQDGVTAIDLDRHGPEEVADIIRSTLASPARHRAMCEAIRAEFDTIDWDAETDSVRELLGPRVAVAA